MTLTLTITTPRCIYQSADYRLFDLRTRQPEDFQTQKIVLVNAFRWTAMICFAGVGRTNNIDVGEWLAERTAAIGQDAPFQQLLDELLTADTWLATVPEPYNKHSFTIGGFVGSKPVFALISNFENLGGLVSARASRRLSLFQMRPIKPQMFVSGQPWAVNRSSRRRLVGLAAQDPKPESMYSALAEENRRVALRTHLVSAACFTAHSRFTGEGGGQVHGLGNRPFVPSFAIPDAAKDAITRLLNEQFGPGQAQLRSITTVRSEPSDEYHATQVKEKPDDPNVHNNYGAYLKDKKGDLQGAEREYRRALELDYKHANALGNLGNLYWEKGKRDEAFEYYSKALEADHGNENASWNYARFLLTSDDRVKARKIVDQAIATHPSSSRLRLLSADLYLRQGDASAALNDYGQARAMGANQVEVEAGYSFALHLSGAPVDECIGAYRVAISLNGKNAPLRLNLAQLMFIRGLYAEAKQQLHEAMRLGLDETAQLEAQFYLLCHTSTAISEVAETIKRLLIRGARLKWDVRANIESIAVSNREKATSLDLVAQMMKGEEALVRLDEALAALDQLTRSASAVPRLNPGK